MSMWEFNKIAGSALAALLLIVASGVVIELAGSRKPEKPGYTLPVSVAVVGGPAVTVAAFDFKAVAPLLSKASADNGQAVFRKCQTCHTPEKGGKNGTGPNLWGVVGRKPGAVDGFAYSDAVKGKEGTWTFEALANYIHDPKGYIPNNKMAFVGVKDNAELADVLAYLRSLADNPAPLPE
jgi:cytochrome c